MLVMLFYFSLLSIIVFVSKITTKRVLMGAGMGCGVINLLCEQCAHSRCVGGYSTTREKILHGRPPLGPTWQTTSHVAGPPCWLS